MHISKHLPFALLLASGVACGQSRIDIEAESAALNTNRMQVVEKTNFSGGKSVVLKPGVEATTDTATTPDITLKVKPSQAGRYVLETRASANDAGREVLARGKTKYDSLFMMISVGNQRPVHRVVFVPWADPAQHYQHIGKFDLTADEQEIRLWMPAGIELDFVRVSPYESPKIPDSAANYKPTVVPPETHPRLWVNAETLPKMRANLTRGENAPLWEKLQDDARKPFPFPGKPGEPMPHNAGLESAAVNKAFLYLASGDKESGREAIALMDAYLTSVEFGNILDITREIGRAMYAGARVYDWCYDLMTPAERDSLRAGMMRLADDMEIGWPPFKQIVVNGHGAEAQLFCHLLSMAIAIYNEDPQPYQYCAYRVLEELVPMRNFEYQSPRHNQGLGYGIYRFTWDMHAAWIFYRMSGQKIFNSNIENVHKYWLQTRLPDGSNFPDGDGNADGRRTTLGLLALLCSAYTGDPVMKYDYVRQGGFPSDPLMVLLLNDPDQKPAKGFGELPLTFEFGDILGGMVARTGWNMGDTSSDVVAFMSGGGYNFFNHQQSDAGSLQLYYHGMQVADLGQYVFYGTPYDLNFNKRSVAHSMMLAYDPNEKPPSAKYINDGGTRTAVSSPGSLDALKNNPNYANGKVLSASYGPAPERPAYSYFSVDLTSAYGNKVRDYVRSFCFLNLDDPANPAALIIADSMETSTPQVQKYWQVNTIAAPRKTGNGVVLSSPEKNQPGHVHVAMLKPAPADRKMEILSGKESTNVFGTQLTPPKPEAPTANGHRILFSPSHSQSSDQFLTVLTMAEAGETTRPVRYQESGDAYVINIADRLVVMSRTGKLLDSAVTFAVEGDGHMPVVITGLKPGEWKLTRKNAADQSGKSVTVTKRKNTADFQLQAGEYTFQPG